MAPLTPIVAIKSVTFGCFISLNGTGISIYQPDPRGEVKTAKRVENSELFYLEKQSDDTVGFRSMAFEDVYLSLIGVGVEAGKRIENGGGSLKAQFGCQGWEKFRIHKKASDPYKAIVGLESVGFPGRYLKCDPYLVNVQGVMSDWEEFELLVVGYE